LKSVGFCRRTIAAEVLLGKFILNKVITISLSKKRQVVLVIHLHEMLIFLNIVCCLREEIRPLKSSIHFYTERLK